MTHRTKTRPVKVGNLTIGGNNELIIQSMTTTKHMMLKQQLLKLNV